MSSEEHTLSKEESIYFKRLKDFKIDNLVLSSGGMSGLMFLGSLHYLYSNNMMSNIKNFIGCSAGAIISLLLVIGYTPFEINQEVIDVDGEKEFMAIDIQNLISNIGFIDNNKVLKIFSNLIEKKLGFIPTMKELYEMTEKELTIASFNYDTFSVEYINYKTHPNLLCSVVATSSCLVPILFSPININDQKYIDGGVVDPFPMSHCKKNYTGKTLGIVLINPQDKKDSSLVNYITSLIFMTTNIKKNKQYLKYLEDKDVCIIKLGNTDNNGMKFTMDKSTKLKLFSSGHKQIREKMLLCSNEA
jgi:predicted acylesterase/phospholipase RssA